MNKSALLGQRVILEKQDQRGPRVNPVPRARKGRLGLLAPRGKPAPQVRRENLDLLVLPESKALRDPPGRKGRPENRGRKGRKVNLAAFPPSTAGRGTSCPWREIIRRKW